MRRERKRRRGINRESCCSDYRSILAAKFSFLLGPVMTFLQTLGALEENRDDCNTKLGVLRIYLEIC